MIPEEEKRHPIRLALVVESSLMEVVSVRES